MQPGRVILLAVTLLGCTTVSLLAPRLWPSKALPMRLVRIVFVSAVVLSFLAAAGLTIPAFANHQAAAVIERVPSSAPEELAKGGTVLGQKGDLLQEGDSGRMRKPPPAQSQASPPMCNDGVWMEWADTYVRISDSAGADLGVCYMLASDIDPYAEEWPRL